MRSIRDYFDRKELCKIWPSNDPDDRPFSDLTCRLCKETLTLQSAGTYMMGEPNFEDRIDMALRAHLMQHCSDEFLERNVHTDTLKAGPAFDILLFRELDKRCESKKLPKEF